MAFVFDATVGGANSNSYPTVAYADDYFGGSLYASDWPATSSGAALLTKQQGLVTATRDFERLTWAGTRSSYSGQRLQFPRANLTDKDGFYITSTEMPTDLLDACCEQALFRIQQNPDNLVDESLKQFKRLKISNVLDMEMRDGTPTENTICERAMELISRWLLVSGGTTRIVRA